MRVSLIRCLIMGIKLNGSRHILSNVGRVASRDSSRSYANSQDLFVALCEDDAIYGLFKSMKGENFCPSCALISASNPSIQFIRRLRNCRKLQRHAGASRCQEATSSPCPPRVLRLPIRTRRTAPASPTNSRLQLHIHLQGLELPWTRRGL